MVGPEFNVEVIAELVRREGSATAFAKRVGVSRTLVASWLSKMVKPQVTTLCRIAETYELPISALFIETPKPPSPGSPRQKKGKKR